MAGIDEVPWPVELQIIGPSQTIPERTSFTFRARLLYDDESTKIVPAEWFLTSNEFGTITPDGVFTAGSVPTGTRSVEAQCSYLDPQAGYVLAAQQTFTVKDTDTPPVLLSLHLDGPTEVPKNSEAEYVVTARYSNGTTVSVEPTSLVSSRPAVATIDLNGNATFAAIRGNATVVFTAQYVNGADTFEATLSIQVIDSAIYPVRGNVFGPAVITENGKAQFGLNVVFENGKNQQVIANWHSSNPKAGELDCNGHFCAASVEGVETTTIIASYEYEGTITSASLELSVLDITVYPESLTIDGPEKIREGLVVQYYTTLRFSNGTRKSVLANLQASDSAGGYLDAGCQFHAASQVSAPTDVMLFAVHETLTSQRFVEVIPSPVLPVRCYIELRSPMYVGEYQSLKFHVVYEDGTDIVLPASWSLSNTHIAEISEGGVLHAIEVVETAELVVRASLNISGVALNAELPVTLIDNKTYPMSISISGPESIRVGMATSYTALALFSDGTERPVSPLWFCADDHVNVMLGRVKATAPGTYHVSVTYTLQHETVTATIEITVS
jgi:hypothetical protein